MNRKDVVPVTLNKLLSFTASNNVNDLKATVRVSLTRYTRLMIMPNLFTKKSERLYIDHNKTHFINDGDTKHYQLDGAQYLGTAASLVTDVLMDIYLVPITYDNPLDNNTTVTKQLFIAFPTLLLLPDANTGIISNVEVNATVFGIEDVGMDLNGSTGTLRSDGDYAYINENVVINTPAKLKTTVMAINGLGSDALFSTIERYNTDTGGQTNCDGFHTTQFIVLGNIEEIVADYPVDGMVWQLSTIAQSGYNQYVFSKPMYHRLKAGTICIPLNF